MKKRRIFLLSALLGLVSAVQADGVNAVVFWKTDGQKVTVLLDEQPKVMFTADALRVQARQSELSFPAGEVRRFTYETVDATGIASASRGEVRFRLSDNVLHLSALQGRSPIEIYSADGKLLRSVAADAAGSGVVDVRGFPAGVYVIKTSVGTLKIRKS